MGEWRFIRMTYTQMSREEKKNDIREYMNIKHFEQLQSLFENNVNEDGSQGFDLEMFVKVFYKVLGGNLSDDELTTLFNKIDANSDGTVSWDEFSSYMMTVSSEETSSSLIIDEKSKKLASVPHRDMLIFIHFIARERKYVTVGREGSISLWSTSLQLTRHINIRDFTPKASWVADAIYLQELNRIGLITDDRRLSFFDVTSIKPRMIASISQLEYNPLCLNYSSNYDDDVDLMLVGDDGGYVNIIKMRRKFLVDNSSENEYHDFLTQQMLVKKDSFQKYNINMIPRKCHSDWVLQVRYSEEMNAYITCSSVSNTSLILGDVERKTVRQIDVPLGVKAFDFIKRPSFLVTGGRDKIIRLWNPYVLSKPAGSLYGHAAAISKIIINHEESHIISLSEDKVIKVWNAKNLQCLQTVYDRIAHRPDNIISSIYYDNSNRQLITGSDKIESWPLYSNSKRLVPKSHVSAVVAVMFHISFHQIVSASQDGTVTIWDPSTGSKIFQYQNAHEKTELTSVCFDKSGRRLITGSRDGVMKMWNYNNGQILKNMTKEHAVEVDDICYIEMGYNRYIVGVGWDRRVNIYIDDPDEYESTPAKVLNGTGSSVHKGHEGDICTVAFHEPNWLATGSIDGAILLWNLEGGTIRFALRDPFLSFRKHDEKPVEKVLFIDDPNNQQLILVSCHADGSIKFWDLNNPSLITDINLQLSKEEGLTSMCIGHQNKSLIIAGSKGHMRIVSIEAARNSKKDSDLEYLHSWRAHIVTISSVCYIESLKVIITAAKDATVRIWTSTGKFIGFFGQSSLWNLSDPSTFMRLPPDVEEENLLEAQRNEMLLSRKQDMKKEVLETWTGVPKASNVQKESVVDFKENVKRLKIRSIQQHCINKWKSFWARKKEAEDWTIPSDLITIKRDSSFFSFSGNIKKRVEYSKKTKNESIYHKLICHDLADIGSPNSRNPTKQAKKKFGLETKRG